MFDIGWSEFLVLAIVALVVVGPKELPALMRTLGRYAGMARRQASEFRSHFDDAMREAEMANLRNELDGVRRDVMTSAAEARAAASEQARKAAGALEDNPVESAGAGGAGGQAPDIGNPQDAKGPEGKGPPEGAKGDQTSATADVAASTTKEA